MVTDSLRQVSGRWRILSLLGSLLVCGLVFFYLFSKVSLTEVLQTLRGISPVQGLLFLLFSLTAVLCRSWRYHLTLATAGYRLPGLPLFLVTLVRNLFADLLPARLGTVIYIFLVQRLGVSVAAAGASFTLCFVFDIFALAFFILAAAISIRSSLISPPVLIGGGLLLGLMSGGVLFGLPQILTATARIVRVLPQSLGAFATRAEEMLLTLAKDIQLALGRKVFWKIFWLSMVLRLFKYLSLYTLFLALVLPMGFSVRSFPFPPVFLGICSAEFAASLPISGIAGFGAYEGAWSLVFQLLGYGEKLAALTSISHHLVTQIYGYLLGGIALLILLLPMFKVQPLPAEQEVQPGGRSFYLRLGLAFWIPMISLFAVLPPRAVFTTTAPTITPTTAPVQEEVADSSVTVITTENVNAGSERGGDLPVGSLVYQCRDGIHTMETTNRQQKRLTTDGVFPRWSPDGKRIGFLRGHEVMVMTARGDQVERVATVQRPRALCFHPDGEHLFFTDEKQVRLVDLRSREVTTVLAGETFLELDIDDQASFLVATVKSGFGYLVKKYELDTGRRLRVARGCSASVSPAGRLICVNGPHHLYLNFYNADTLKPAGRISAPAGNRFDNQFWSNDSDWLVSTSEVGGHHIYIHRISTDTAFEMTTEGDCDRGDLFVR